MLIFANIIKLYRMEKTKLNRAHLVIQRALKKNLYMRVTGLPWGDGTETIIGVEADMYKGRSRHFLKLPNKLVLDLETSLHRIEVQDIYGKWYPLFHRGVFEESYTVNWIESDHEQYLNIHFDNCIRGNLLSKTDGQFLGVIVEVFVDTIEHTYELVVLTTPNNPKAEIIEFRPEHIIYSILAIKPDEN